LGGGAGAVAESLGLAGFFLDRDEDVFDGQVGGEVGLGGVAVVEQCYFDGVGDAGGVEVGAAGPEQVDEGAFVVGAVVGADGEDELVFAG
jgi:hypothetical protein